MSDPSLARTAPTEANEGQCRSTKTKKGPNNARRAVWAVGVFFFHFFSSISLTTNTHSSQQRPPKANAGPQKPTLANAGQRRPTKAHGSQRRPTKANAGQRRPTAANDGQQRPTQALEDKKGPNDARRM